jgi:hypothetical protein
MCVCTVIFFFCRLLFVCAFLFIFCFSVCICFEYIHFKQFFLQNLKKIKVKPNLPKREERVPPIKWTADQLLGWIKSVSNGRFASVANDLPKGTTGKVVMRWGNAQFSTICGGPDIGGALQRLLQEERARCDQLEQLKRQDRLG